MLIKKIPLKNIATFSNTQSKSEGGFTESKLPPIKRLTLEEMKAMREKNLCFNCDEIIHIGHECKKLYLILGEEDDNEDVGDTLELDEIRGDQGEPQSSLNAVIGQSLADTIKLLSRAKRKEIAILLDSGSTHNFLNPYTIERLGCVMEYTNPCVVTIADENKVECNSRCPYFEWEMGGYKFSTPVRLLRLGVEAV